MEGVLAWAEVPWLLLRVIITVFETLQLVVEVDHVVGLLVAEGRVLILCEHINHVLLLGLFNRLLRVLVRVDLRDRVIEGLLLLNELSSDLLVGFLLALEVTLLVDIVGHVGLPLVVAGRQVVLR